MSAESEFDICSTYILHNRVLKYHMLVVLPSGQPHAPTFYYLITLLWLAREHSERSLIRNTKIYIHQV